MKIVQKRGLLPEGNWDQPDDLTLLLLHDTASRTLKIAEDTLKERGLSYHAMIDVDGTIYQYHDWDAPCNHAKGFNKGSVGISLVGGTQGSTYYPFHQAQLDAVVELLNKLKEDLDIKKFSSHRECSFEGKIDPEFKPFQDHMNDIADKTNLIRYIGNN